MADLTLNLASCILAIVLLNDVGDIPSKPPGPYIDKDVASFNELWTPVALLNVKCPQGRPSRMGYTVAGKYPVATACRCRDVNNVINGGSMI